MSSRRCAAIVSIGLALSATRAVASPSFIVERRSVGLHIVAPKLLLSTNRSSDLRTIAASEIGPLYALNFVSAASLDIDTAALESCAVDVQLTCWTALLSRAAVGKRTMPAYLLVVTIQPLEDGKQRLASLFLDVQSAIRERDRATANPPEEIETRIFERAAQSHVYTADVAYDVELRQFVRHLFLEELAAVLSAAGEHRPNGTLTIRSRRSGLTVSLDGESVGVMRADEPMTLNLDARSYTVSLHDPEQRFVHLPIRLAIARGATSVLEPVLLPGPAHAGDIRDAIFWTGLAASVSGIAVATYGWVASKQNVLYRPCVAGRCPITPTGLSSLSDFGTSAYDSERRGVLVAPLGYSLLISGAVWAVGAKLIGDEEDVPWTVLLIGVASGALSYSLSALLN